MHDIENFLTFEITYVKNKHILWMNDKQLSLFHCLLTF